MTVVFQVTRTKKSSSLFSKLKLWRRFKVIWTGDFLSRTRNLEKRDIVTFLARVNGKMHSVTS
jgi:hypothetical protein